RYCTSSVVSSATGGSRESGRGERTAPGPSGTEGEGVGSSRGETLDHEKREARSVASGNVVETKVVSASCSCASKAATAAALSVARNSPAVITMGPARSREPLGGARGERP